MTATKKKEKLFYAPPARYLELLKRSGVLYVGPSVLQAAGAWTRVGAAWMVPGIGWVIFGPGVGRWNTKRGLAQLASEDTVTPEWHANGWAVSPQPNVVFALMPQAKENYPEIDAICDEADAWWSEIQGAK